MAAVKQLNPKAEVARAAQALDLNISGKQTCVYIFCIHGHVVSPCLTTF